MKELLAKQIEKEFPFMDRDSIEGNNIYKNYGFECGEGWYHVIRSMCKEIEDAYERAGKEIDLVPVQCKEKFGTLRFYYDVNGEKKTMHAFDFIGECSLRFQNKDSELYKEIADIVEKCEEESAHVCEWCGKPAELRTDLGWISTLCDECYEKRKNKMSQKRDMGEHLD